MIISVDYIAIIVMLFLPNINIPSDGHEVHYSGIGSITNFIIGYGGTDFSGSLI